MRSQHAKNKRELELQQIQKVVQEENDSREVNSASAQDKATALGI